MSRVSPLILGVLQVTDVAAYKSNCGYSIFSLSFAKHWAGKAMINNINTSMRFMCHFPRKMFLNGRAARQDAPMSDDLALLLLVDSLCLIHPTKLIVLKLPQRIAREIL